MRIVLRKCSGPAWPHHNCDCRTMVGTLSEPRQLCLLRFPLLIEWVYLLITWVYLSSLGFIYHRLALSTHRMGLSTHRMGLYTHRMGLSTHTKHVYFNIHIQIKITGSCWTFFVNYYILIIIICFVVKWYILLFMSQCQWN